MSSNKPKDDADRLAEALVRVEQVQDEDAFNVHIGTHWDYHTTNASLAELARREIVENVASAIRKAIEDRDRILTDMLSESEAFCEGWRQGAAAMKASIIESISKEWSATKVAGFTGKTLLEMVLEAAVPQPPSHDASGEPLTPSPVHLRAQRLELALRAIAKIQVNPVIDFMPLLTQIASEALEELTNE